MSPIEKAALDIKKTLSHSKEIQNDVMTAFLDYCESLINKFGTESSLRIILSICNKYSPDGEIAFQIFSILDKMILGITTELSLEMIKDERKKANR